MQEELRPSLEEASKVTSQGDALDYIAKRGQGEGFLREKRLLYAKMLLEQDFLPHISTTEDGTRKKAYFLGYMINRLLQVHLKRAREDDRDYYGKKRLDMSGSLLASLFR